LARHNAQHMGSYSMRTARSPGARRYRRRSDCGGVDDGLRCHALSA
jgi:hypothetical protein